MWKARLNQIRIFKSRFAGILFDHRWLLMLLLSASAILFEILEHQNVDNPVDIHFVREIVFFGIIYPLAAGLLLNALLQVQTHRDRVISQQEQAQVITREMMAAENKAELGKTIINFVRTIASVEGIHLFLCSEEHHTLILENNWWLKPTSRQAHRSTGSIPADFCGMSAHIPEKRLHPFSRVINRKIQSSMDIVFPYYRKQQSPEAVAERVM